MTGKIPYYYVSPKNGRAYWRPNKRMMRVGFGCVALGPAGEEAEQEARGWNVRWQKARTEDVLALGKRALGPPSKDQFIYFLQLGDRVKIGVSHRPIRRLGDLTGSASASLKRLVVVIGSRNDERLLHQRFKSYRTGGEWFVASRPLLLAMSRCAAAGHIVHEGEPERNGLTESNQIQFESRSGGAKCLK